MKNNIYYAITMLVSCYILGNYAFAQRDENKNQQNLYKLHRVKTIIYTSEYVKIVSHFDTNGTKMFEITYTPNDSSISIPKYDQMGLRIGDSSYAYVSKIFQKNDPLFDENGKRVGSKIVSGNDRNESSMTEIRWLYDTLDVVYGSVTIKDGKEDTAYFKYNRHYEDDNIVYIECECFEKSIYYPVMMDSKSYYTDNKLIKREQISKNCKENFSILHSTETFTYFDNGLLKESVLKYELDIPNQIVKYGYIFYK